MDKSGFMIGQQTIYGLLHTRDTFNNANYNDNVNQDM